MYQFFLICGTIGGTILILRLAMGLMGLGMDHFDGLGMDLHTGDVHADHLGESQAHDSHLGRLFTFQGIVSLVAFFGIGGLAALSGGLHPAAAVGVGVATGMAAVVLLGVALGSLTKLNTDGTVRLENAVGLTGTVYLRIPAEHGGEGKITLPIQGRTIEVRAKTPGPELRLGEAVVVHRILDDQTVEVVLPQAHVVKPAALVE
jgi:hypothetical protein